LNTTNNILAGMPLYPIPRAELWLGTELLKQAGFDDTLANHIQLVEQLGQDMVCLPVADNPSEKPNLGYRYFGYADLKAAIQLSDKIVTAVVDGPFQELVNRLGLMEVLTRWGRRNRGEIIKAYVNIQESVLSSILCCLDQGIHAVVIADDIAADRALLISPKDIDMLFTPFYERAVSAIHKADAHVFFHSCGKINQLLPLVKKWRIDGLAAVQHRTNDLVELHQTLDSKVVIMAGIEAEFLAADNLDKEMQREFEYIVNSLSPLHGLILCSGSGLYKGDFLERIKKIYDLADQITGERKKSKTFI
jgi:hypothetical protein